VTCADNVVVEGLLYVFEVVEELVDVGVMLTLFCEASVGRVFPYVYVHCYIGNGLCEGGELFCLSSNDGPEG